MQTSQLPQLNLKYSFEGLHCERAKRGTASRVSASWTGNNSSTNLGVQKRRQLASLGKKGGGGGRPPSICCTRRRNPCSRCCTLGSPVSQEPGARCGSEVAVIALAPRLTGKAVATDPTVAENKRLRVEVTALGGLLRSGGHGPQGGGHGPQSKECNEGGGAHFVKAGPRQSPSSERGVCVG